jgi:hypothetical protein
MNSKKIKIVASASPYNWINELSHTDRDKKQIVNSLYKEIYSKELFSQYISDEIRRGRIQASFYCYI